MSCSIYPCFMTPQVMVTFFSRAAVWTGRMYQGESLVLAHSCQRFDQASGVLLHSQDSAISCRPQCIICDMWCQYNTRRFCQYVDCNWLLFTDNFKLNIKNKTAPFFFPCVLFSLYPAYFALDAIVPPDIFSGFERYASSSSQVSGHINMSYLLTNLLRLLLEISYRIISYHTFFCF